MSTQAGEGRVVAFPAPRTARRSDVYTVSAGGVAVPVERFEDVHYAHFAFDGQVEITVGIPPSIGHRNLHFIHAFEISPRRYGVQATADVNTLTFTLDRPRKLIIRVNEHQRLFLFADAIPESEPKPGDPSVVDVMDFVTDNTGKTLQTRAIAAAVEATPKGGTLFFPPGVYLSGTIRPKSDMTLYLAGGALVKGSSDPADFPADADCWHWANQALLYIARCSNVRVAGFGTFDGNGTVLRAMQAGPHACVVVDSSDILLEDVFLRDPATQNTHPVNVERFVARNLKIIDNRNVLNTDGVDLSSTRHALVEDCFTYTSDDAIVVKTYGAHESRDIVARRNVILSKKSALKVGTETEADILDVTFIDNEVVECDRGLSLYVEDGATVRNIRYINNRFEGFIPDARRRLLDFYIWNRSNGGGNLADVLVKDCEADVKWPRPSTIIGLDEEHAIRGIRFDNFRIAGRVAATVEEADILVDVYPFEDMRRPAVYDITFEPGGGRWNPALVAEYRR